jgi:hypothetical protein
VYFKAHKSYSRNIKLGIIVSELILITLFKFFPDLNSSNQFKYDNDPIILMSDIPVTIQSTKKKAFVKPSAPKIVFIDEIEEPEILEDVQNVGYTSYENDDVVNESNAAARISLLSMMPRQVLEVLPDKKADQLNGEVNLYVKINENGQVTEHKILYNSLNCTDCLSRVIIAVYKSRWEPAMINGKQVEYWVEKTYNFN